jgi:hypothetical protein
VGTKKTLQSGAERKLRRDGVDEEEKDQAGQKEREQQNNLNIESVYDLG